MRPEIRKWIALLVMFVTLTTATLGADSCGSGSSGGGSGGGGSHHGSQGGTATTAGSFDHCRKVTGSYMFRVEGLPFTARYRDAIDKACRASQPSSNVAAVAEVAKEIARGELP